MNRSLGLYIHIPFCRSKCLYCDFCSFPHRSEESMQAYVRTLCADLKSRSQDCTHHTVDTVYIGGGTPTILPIRLLCDILETVQTHYRLSDTAEISAECNPATGGRSYFADMHALGFNRLSIGLQSAQPNELRALGRTHDFAGFAQTFDDARQAGFENISADLMFGIPQQTPESYLDSLRQLTSLSPEHISAYGLTVEDGTPFSRMSDRLVFPDEEVCREMYFEGIELLASYGYDQYEISNFARRGYASRHNLKYWNCEEYLGFGPAAYSDFCGDRFGNSRDLSAYIEGKRIECERETPNRAERLREYLMLGLRLADGVRTDDLSARFGKGLDEEQEQTISRHIALGYAARTPHGFRLTPAGFYVSNAILCELLDFSE